MKQRHVKLLAPVIALLTFVAGCSLNTVETDTVSASGPVPEHKVESISESHPLVREFLNYALENNFASKVAGQFDLENLEIMTLTETGTQILVVPVILLKNSPQEEQYVYFESSTRRTFSVTSSHQDDFEKVITKKLDDDSSVTLLRDTKTGRIQLVKDDAASKTAVPDCWVDCMDTAVSACMGDWLCIIECGLVFSYCVAAIAIACGISCNN